MRILFVCLGNICRSPLAEGIFNHKASTGRYPALMRAESAGTADYHVGELPDIRMRKTAAAKGIHLQSRARQFSASDFDRYDWIIAMDDQNFMDIQNLKPESHRARVYKMGFFVDPIEVPDIPDPWFGGQDGFDEVFEMLDRATGQLIQHLQDELVKHK